MSQEAKQIARILKTRKDLKPNQRAGLLERLRELDKASSGSSMSGRELGNTDIRSLAFLFQTATNQFGDEAIRAFSPEAADSLEAASKEFQKENPNMSRVMSVVTPDLIDLITAGASKLGKIPKALEGLGVFKKMFLRGASGSTLDQLGEGKIDNFEPEDLIKVPAISAATGLASGLLGKGIQKGVDSTAFRKLQSGLGNTQAYKALIKKNGGDTEAAIKELESFIERTGARGSDVVGYDVAKGHYVDSQGNFPKMMPELQEVSAKELNKRFKLARDKVGKEIGDIVNKVSKKAGKNYKEGDVGLVDKQQIVDQIDKGTLPRKVTTTDENVKYDNLESKTIDFMFAPNPEARANAVKDVAGARAKLSDIEAEVKNRYTGANEEAIAIKDKFDFEVKEYKKSLKAQIAEKKLKLRNSWGDVQNKAPKLRSEIKKLEAELNSDMSMEKLAPERYKTYKQNQMISQYKDPKASPEYRAQEEVVGRQELNLSDIEDKGQIPLKDIHDQTKNISSSIDWGVKRGKDADPIKEQAQKNVRASLNKVLNERINPTDPDILKKRTVPTYPRFTPLREEYGRLTDLTKTTQENINQDVLGDIVPPSMTGKGYLIGNSGRTGFGYNIPLIGDKLGDAAVGARSFMSGAIDKPTLNMPQLRGAVKTGISKEVEEEGRRMRSPDSVPMESTMTPDMIKAQMEMLQDKVRETKLSRNSDDNDPKMLMAKIASVGNTEEAQKFEMMVGKHPFDMVKGAIELNDMEALSGLMVPLVEFMPSMFPRDKYDTVNNTVALPMRPVVQRDVFLDKNLSNTEKAAKIRELNSTGRIS